MQTCVFYRYVVDLKGLEMRREAVLQRVEEVDGEDVGFLREVARAHPVGSAHGLLRLSQEAADFLDEVVLGAVELLAIGPPEIALRCVDVVAGALLRRGLLLGRKPRRDPPRWRRLDTSPTTI